VDIQVLGPLAVDGSGRLGPRDRSVLLALTVRQGRSVTSDELIDAVWGDRPPPSARKNLQSCVVRLRRTLGTGAIETTHQGYRLVVPADDIDAARFEAQVTRARELLAVGEADRVVFLLENALELWTGPAFADLRDWGPARREAGRLDDLRLDAEELLLDAQLRCGRAHDVLARAHEMVRSAPLRERRWELLALAQYRAGAQGEALRTIRQLRAVLARELGIDPAPEVVALEASILRQDPSLQQDDPVALASVTCPWQGLQAYDVAEADRFFGRETEIEAGLAILAEGRLLALVGPSGSGKSSLMRAGIGARLQQRGIRCVTITPGRYPTHAIPALAHLGAGDAVLVDQAEELFTLCEDPDESRAFIDRLVNEAADRPVVVALRADRLADLTAYPAFSRVVERGLYLVGGLDEAGLRLAVTGPARQAGLLLEPGLVDLLVSEVRDDPGALPLLSHALLETWKRREGNTLTVDGYRASGGIHGAVAQSAEQLYAQVEPGQRSALRDLVLRLLSPGAEGEPVRTRVPRRLVGNDIQQDRLIEMLVAARLVTSDDGVLEITHESLARAWPRLQGWLEDDVDGRRILHHLSSTADAWDTLGRPDSELYRGVRLTRALDWAAGTGATLTAVERDFLDASRVQAELEEHSAAERARTQARMIRRLRVVLGGAVVLLVLALLAGGFAAVQSDRANENAARAEHAAVASDALRVGARAQLADDISLSLLLAVAGARLDESPGTRVNLLDAMGRHPSLVRSAPPVNDYLEGFTVSPDGRWIASSDDRNAMHLYDASTLRWEDSYDAGDPPDDEQAFIVGSFSPDSNRLAIALSVGSTEPVRVLDPLTMEQTTTLNHPGDRKLWAYDVQFSGDGRYLAATMNTSPFDGETLPSGDALVWDMRSPSAPPERVPTGRAHQGLALSPDGRTLYTSWPLTAYDVATGRRIWRRTGVSSYLTLDVSPSGALLVLADHDVLGDGLVVDARTGRTLTRLRGHDAQIRDARFAPDGEVVGTVSHDGELILWEAATGRRVAGWSTHAPWGVGFSPDGDLVYGGGAETMLRAWDLEGTQTYLTSTGRVAGTPELTDAAVSPDGRRVALTWVDDQDRGWVRFVDTRTGGVTPPTRVPASADGWPNRAWRDGEELYLGHWCDIECPRPGTVTVLNAGTGAVVRQRRVVDADLFSLAFVDQGRLLLVGDGRGRVHFLDPETLEPVGARLDVSSDCCATPIGDGSTVLVYDDLSDGLSERWRVIDVGTRRVVSEGDLDLRAHTSVASPDGTTVAVAGQSTDIVTIDLATGAQQRATTANEAGVAWLDYSEDGELLVAGSFDGSATLWDARTLEHLGTVRPPHQDDPVPVGVGFVDGTHDVAVASYDGSVHLWYTDLERAIDFACQMAGRDLTEEEWEQVLPAQPYRSVCPQD
jgi:DNA-binding SARP family transcriptional activator/WD40 repeat protein/energy-coupling factor transporter ATP-binding protein EcfA2